MRAKHHSRLTSQPPREVIKVNMRHLDFFLISLCVFHLFTLCEGRALRKRTVSEVQLMHNVGKHKQVKERKEWLLTTLQGIHTAAASLQGGSGGGSSSEELTRTRRRQSSEELPDLSDMTPEEIQYALDFFEKLLKSKQA